MNNEVALKLLALRKQHGFSQEELAEKLGVSRQAVSKWERSEASPDTENLIALARIYSISLDRLFDLDVDSTEQRSTVSLEKKSGYTEEKTESDREAYSGMRVAYPENSAAEEKYNTVYAEQPAAENERPYMEPEQQAGYDGYFKYETVDDDAGTFSDSRSVSGLSELADRIQNDSKFYKTLMHFPYPLAVAGAFFTSGAFLNLWHPMWMLFLTIPLYYTTIAAVKHRNANIFCYPVFVTLMYLIAGFLLNLWHPGWLSFLTIPVYYWAGNLGRADRDEES